MKKFFLAAVITAISSSAMAADAVYTVPQAPVAVETSDFSWTGFSAGVQGGYGWTDQDIQGIFIPSGTVNTDSNGAVLRGFAGFNYQFSNNLVLGIEGDVDHNWGNGTYTVLAPDFYEFGMDWQGSVRGRVGYAFDRALVYGTAGWAVGRGYLAVPGFGKEKETFNGYTVGAGVDYAFTDLIFGRIEYRYTDFGDKNYDFPVAPTLNSDITQQAVRIGLGVKF